MTEYLPYGGFRWLGGDEIDRLKFEKLLMIMKLATY